MALNVTTAVFSEGCNTATATPSLAQWDVGQILKIEGVDLPSAYQVDFSTEYTRNAIQKIGNAAGVAIPNELLQRSAPITAYIVLHEGENDRETEYWITIHITPRTPPETVTPDPEEMSVIDQTIAALQEGVADAEASASAAAGSATAADGSAEDAEAWAVGQRAGEDVPDTDPTYHNNSKYYAGRAAAAAEEAGQHEASWETWARRAETAAGAAEGSATAAGQSKTAAEAAAQTATQKATEAGNSAAAAAGSAASARQTVDGAIGAINTARDGALTAIGSAGSNAVGAVEQAGTMQTGRVTTEGNTQVNRVQSKGDEVIGSIPQDYTDLVDDVDDLSRQLSDVEENQIPELKNAITQINLNTELYVMDVQDWVSYGDNTSYYNYDGYTITLLKSDGRSEVGLYKFWLEAGVKYAVVTDGVSRTATTFQIYAPSSRKFAFNGNQSTNDGAELVFTPPVSDYYTLKFTNLSSFPQYITNLKIVNYDLWRKINNVAVVPDFLTGFTDAQNINHALKHASFHNFSRVYVPYKANGYTLEESLKIYSNTELVTDNTTLFSLGDNVNSEMISNANISLTSTHIDTNITINGGIWDGNRSNQDKWVLDGSTKKKLVVGFLFVGVDYLIIKNATIQNTRTYGCLIGNSNDINIHDIVMNVGDMSDLDNGDGIHFLGPSSRIYVHDCKLHSEDNVIAVNADDVDHGDLITTTGDITDVEISNIYINNYDGGQGMLLLSADHKLENARVQNISGVGQYLLHLSTFGLGTGNGNYRNITISDVEFNLLGGTPHVFSVIGNHFNLSFSSIKIGGIDWATATQCRIFRIGREDGSFYTNIRDIVIDGVYVNGDGNGKLLKIAETFANTTISNITFTHLYSNDNISGCYLYPLIIHQSIIYNLQMTDCNFNNLRSGIMTIDNASAVLRTCFIDNISTDSYSAIKVYNPYDVTINEFVAGNCFNAAYGFETPNCLSSVTSKTTRTSDQLPNQPTYFNTGDIIVSPLSESIGFKCTVSGTRYTNYRQPNTSYSRGTIRKYGEYLLICVTDGTSGDGDFNVYENVESKDGTCYWRTLFKGNAEFVEI